MYSKMTCNYNYNITTGYDILIIFSITGEKLHPWLASRGTCRNSDELVRPCNMTKCQRSHATQNA